MNKRHYDDYVVMIDDNVVVQRTYNVQLLLVGKYRYYLVPTTNPMTIDDKKK
jgi:hypothetical protein